MCGPPLSIYAGRSIAGVLRSLSASAPLNMFAITGALIFSVLFTAGVRAQNVCDRAYEVVSGDTCDGISAKENVST